MANKITELFKKKPLFRDNNLVRENINKILQDIKQRMIAIEKELEDIAKKGK